MVLLFVGVVVVWCCCVLCANVGCLLLLYIVVCWCFRCSLMLGVAPGVFCVCVAVCCALVIADVLRRCLLLGVSFRCLCLCCCLGGVVCLLCVAVNVGYSVFALYCLLFVGCCLLLFDVCC